MLYGLLYSDLVYVHSSNILVGRFDSSSYSYLVDVRLFSSLLTHKCLIVLLLHLLKRDLTHPPIKACVVSLFLLEIIAGSHCSAENGTRVPSRTNHSSITCFTSRL